MRHTMIMINTYLIHMKRTICNNNCIPFLSNFILYWLSCLLELQIFDLFIFYIRFELYIHVQVVFYFYCCILCDVELQLWNCKIIIPSKKEHLSNTYTLPMIKIICRRFMTIQVCIHINSLVLSDPVFT